MGLRPIGIADSLYNPFAGISALSLAAMTRPPQITSWDFVLFMGKIERAFRAGSIPLGIAGKPTNPFRCAICNLYSITTNQAAITGLYRVIQPVRRQLAACSRQ